MLKTMRDSFHHLKWTLWAVVIVFVLGFVYFSGSSAGPADRASQVIATVGATEITGAEFERIYQARLDNYREQYRGGLTPEMLRFLDLPRQVLDGMIQRKLELEEARRLKLKVGNDEVARAVMAYPAFQQNGQFIGRDKYVQLLSRYGYTPERFEEELREDLLAGKYAEMVRASILVPESELAREFATRNDKATIEYVLIPASRLESGVQPTDTDLKGYYEKHRERYRKPEQRRIKYLLVDQAKVRAKVAPTDSELRAEYALRRDALKVPEQVVTAHILIKTDPAKGPEADAAAQAKAEKVLSRAKAGEDFAKLAKESSEDASNKDTGGQLPPFSRGPDGRRVRTGRLRHVARGDRRPRQDAVRLPRDQDDREEPRARAELRGGARRPGGRPVAAQGRSRDEPPGPRARRARSRSSRVIRTRSCASSRTTS